MLIVDVLVMEKRGVVRVVVVDGLTVIEINLSAPAEIVKREDVKEEEKTEKEVEENVSETEDEETMKTEEDPTEAKDFLTLFVSFERISNEISEVNDVEVNSAVCVPSFKRIIDIPSLTLAPTIRVYARAMVEHGSLCDVH